TSLKLVSSATQMLKNGLGPSAVCARAYPDFDGVVSSATTFQTLPSPLPVLAAVQPLGVLPTSSLLKVIVRGFSSAARTTPAIASRASTHSQRMGTLLLVGHDWPARAGPAWRHGNGEMWQEEGWKHPSPVAWQPGLGVSYCRLPNC